MTLRIGFLAVALLVNGAAALAARLRRAISVDGAIAAAVLGTVTLYAGGLFFWAMLMLFFLTSTAASRFGRDKKRALDRMHAKGSERDAVQVLANGGVAMVSILLFAVTGHEAYAVATAASFAAANADTWASELGVLSSSRPRSILTGRPLPTGTSGGITFLGTAAAVGGSALIALWFALGAVLPKGDGLASIAGIEAARGDPLLLLAVVLAAGAVGTTVDSILGASVQAQYRRSDESVTERPAEESGPNRLVRGVRWVTNDAVNFLSSLAAAAFAGGLSLLV